MARGSPRRNPPCHGISVFVDRVILIGLDRQKNDANGHVLQYVQFNAAENENRSRADAVGFGVQKSACLGGHRIHR